GPQHVAPEPTIEERRRLSVRVRDLDHERQSVRAQRRGLASRLEHIAEPSNRALAALDAARDVAGQRGQADPCDGLETEAHEAWRARTRREALLRGACARRSAARPAGLMRATA